MTVIVIAIVIKIVIYFISLFQGDTASHDDMTMIFRKLLIFLYQKNVLDGVEGVYGYTYQDNFEA